MSLYLKLNLNVVIKSVFVFFYGTCITLDILHIKKIKLRNSSELVYVMLSFEVKFLRLILISGMSPKSSILLLSLSHTTVTEIKLLIQQAACQQTVFEKL